MKKKIIVADDDRSIVDVLTMILEDAGYEVESTSNGQTIQKVSEYLPDLLLLDIWMIGVDGRDICKYLKDQKLTKNLPIIMLSANKDTEKISKEAGADDFIAKPFDMDTLLAKAAQHIK
ncbi:MAG: response regulator [bacterium]|nr:response regulator [bacterium]